MKDGQTNDLRTLQEDYRYDADIMCADDERVRLTKWAVSQLDDVDRTIILLYAELGSLRKLGARLGVSHATIRKEVQRIRAEIVSYMTMAEIKQMIREL